MTEDVVIYKVKDREVVSWGRDTQAVAEAFIRDPKWPATKDDAFIAVDDWGYGKITAASRGYENWIGETIDKWRREVHSA
jgi:hypothetical protein